MQTNQELWINVAMGLAIVAILTSLAALIMTGRMVPLIGVAVGMAVLASSLVAKKKNKSSTED